MSPAEAGGQGGAGGSSRTLEIALCVTALLWFAAADALSTKAARGLTERFGAEDYQGLVAVIFVLFLVVTGLRVIDLVARRGERAGLALPRRKGWSEEFGVGAAVGWGLAAAAVLPVALSGNLHAHVGILSTTVALAAARLGTLALICLLEELVARGYAFRRLIAAVGESWATVLLSVGFGVALVWGDAPERWLTAAISGTVLGVLLSIAYLRTYALWLGWGLHFGYRAAAAVLFGLPVAGHAEFSSVVMGYTTGRPWLAGGEYGLDAALLTVAVLLAGLPVLFRVTRDWAWSYTHVLPVGAGYAVEVAPPAAHAAMETAAAAKAPGLVQILPNTPQAMSKGGE